jgi:hypothetical protein
MVDRLGRAVQPDPWTLGPIRLRAREPEVKPPWTGEPGFLRCNLFSRPGVSRSDAGPTRISGGDLRPKPQGRGAAASGAIARSSNWRSMSAQASMGSSSAHFTSRMTPPLSSRKWAAFDGGGGGGLRRSPLGPAILGPCGLGISAPGGAGSTLAKGAGGGTATCAPATVANRPRRRPRAEDS